MNEIWKTVTVNSDYEVSNLGNIRSNKRGNPRLLRPFPRGGHKKDEENRGRYLAVRLLSNGEERDYPIHRLVAMAFIPNPQNMPMVNHKNGIRDDNRVENLEWCDNSYNIWHSYNVLGNKTGIERAVVQYGDDGAFIKEYESTWKAEIETGISARFIASVCRKESYRKKAGGFIWRYKGDDDTSIKYDKISPVVQISKYGEKITTFNSVGEAAISIGISIGGISGVCMKRTRGYNYAGGFLWRYEDEYDENEFGYFLDKTFIQMTLNNLPVAEHKGTHELVDNGFELIKVIMCCRGQRRSTNGFKWCIKEEGDKSRGTRREKPVVKLDKKTLEYICEYPSAVLAGKDVKTSSTHISRCCLVGTNISAGGFRWMYKDEYEKLKE